MCVFANKLISLHLSVSERDESFIVCYKVDKLPN